MNLYLLKHIEDIFFLIELEAFDIPIRYTTFPGINIHALYNIADKYDRFCQKYEGEIEKDDIPLLEYAAFKNLYNLDDNSQKRQRCTRSSNAAASSPSASSS